MRRPQPNPEPDSRVGNCAGCGSYPVLLFKVPGIFRYRCDSCFEQECGYRHHLAPPKAPPVLILP